MEFQDLFKRATKGKDPFRYQVKFATDTELPELLDAPTGVGKTATAILGWLWRRCFAGEEIRSKTPRRLVYCLPMRTLVEQTFVEAKQWIAQAEKIGLSEPIDCHILMGGAVSNDWDRHPERSAILIGTQDQLLSRALNRGYSMSRYRWPMHFALLNNDCLWVMDETQLMGNGLKTTAQLQGFRELFGTYGTAQSLWMSATLDPDVLRTVNHRPEFRTLTLDPETDLKEGSKLKQRIEAHKQLVQAKTSIALKDEEYAKALVAEIGETHTPGTLTLIICNRVSRAQAVFKALSKKERVKDEPRLLVHSRFRPADRAAINQQIRDFKDGILVATQAIEAGVDISAQTLFTELAPWSSLVQRFGRCNRYGECNENAAIYWIDIDLDKKGAAAPYENEDLEKARELLCSIEEAGPAVLKQVPAPPQVIEGIIPRQQTLLQLFDTSSDLAGHDVDISPFIREAEDNDVAIAWRDWASKSPPSDMPTLHRDELCSVNVNRAREFLKNKTAWIWDSLSGAWVETRKIYPGLSLLLQCSDGGYDEELGFTGGKEKPAPIDLKPDQKIEQNQDAGDPLTYKAGDYVTLLQHSQATAGKAQELCSHFPDFDLPVELIVKSARWHDLGKAHLAFQEMLTKDRPERQNQGPWAKSDHRSQMSKERRGFRHELVSALVALQEKQEFLLAYLVAAHHGKVRMTIQPRPGEKAPSNVNLYALGVHDGDPFPGDPFEKVDLGDGFEIQKQTLSLACMQLGRREGESWAAQSINLLKEHGPFKLAFLETLVRVADWNATREHANPEASESLDRTDA